MADAWITLPISKVYCGLFDGPHATPAPSAEGPVFLGISNITDSGRLDLSDIRHIAEEDYAQWTRRVLPRQGDIVFSYEATLHRYAMIPEGFRGCLGRRLALIRPDESLVCGRFLYYYLLSPSWYNTVCENINIGATVDRIPLVTLPRFEITMPPLPTQRKIAAILSSYDELIENNTRRIRILEEMAQAIYREWFVNFRFPGHEKVRMVDSELRLIPEGWEAGNVSSIVEVRSGYAFKSSAFNDRGEYGLVTIRNVKDGEFLAECASRIDRVPASMPDHCLLATGDVLLSLTGNIGRTCLVWRDSLLLNQRVAKLVPKAPAGRAYVYSMFRCEETQARLQSISNGVAQQNLSPIEMCEIKVILPPGNLIESYEETAGPMVEQMLALSRTTANLRQTRDLLLPKLVSGEVDVSEFETEARNADGGDDPVRTV